MIHFDDVVKSVERIDEYIYNTPLDYSIYLSSSKTNTSVFLKLECQQKLRGFKIRGALSKLTNLTEEEKAKGVLAVSSGNHGAGVSYAAHVLGGIKAKIYVPETIPASKLDKIKYYGADVVAVGKNYDEAHAAALKALEEEKLTFVDPCSDVDVIAGQGTIATEILKANPDIDTIIVPIGGGGLITGISVAAKHIKPSINVIGVQTVACPAMKRAMEDQVFYEDFPSEPSICDALVGGVGEIPYKMSRKCIDDIIIVEEEKIKEALLFLIQKEKIIAEPAGAVGVAAFMANPEVFRNRNVAIVISGGNLDYLLIKSIINKEIIDKNYW